MDKATKPVVLVICDGWGVAPDSAGNAITRARTPNFSKYLREYPAMSLYASGTEVGLMFGEIGNSEVGHLNIGAGRVYYQSCPRINQSIADKTFFSNQAFLGAVEHVKKNKSRLHLIGLLSSGNVHASTNHLYALLELAAKEKVKEVFVHVILDGRDCTYNAGLGFVRELEEKMKTLKTGTIATLSGRFYGMDRDNRWERVGAAYQAMALGKAEHTTRSAVTAIEESYASKVYDEEFVPTVVVDTHGKALATIGGDDAAIFFNFRPDRGRELTKAFVLPGFDKFERTYARNLYFVTMMEYEKDLPARVAFPPQVVRMTLAETISKRNLKQLHIAETEKYAHVTFFLNGTIEEAYPGEDRLLVPSPKVASYAEAPDMSAPGITKELLKAMQKKAYDFVVVNFANADMVGHTGNVPATIKGCEAVDKCLGQIVELTLSMGGAVIMTADHGNAEEVVNLQTGEIDKEHSTNPVPFLVISKDLHGLAGPSGDPPEGDLSLLTPVGVLADVAPTILKLMGVDAPPEMTGRPLL